MKYDDILKRAVEIRNKYDELNKTKRDVQWNEQALMAGFVGDVGELSTIIMAKHGLRDMDDIDDKLAHELADCLWSVLVLASKYNIDLATEFMKTMDGLEARIARESRPQPTSFGVVPHNNSTRPTDFLYRVSLKCFIRNAKGEVLVVKETGRDWWDLPGGGMDHGEDMKSAIAREMKEEVNLESDFTYKIIAVDEPGHLKAHNFWQIRLIFEVIPHRMVFSAGDDGDEIAFINPERFKNSDEAVERRIYRYSMETASSSPDARSIGAQKRDETRERD